MGQGPHPDYKGGSIQRLDPKTGEAKLLYAECGGHKLSAPNDIVFDKGGGFYFTDLGKRYARHRDHGGVYYALARRHRRSSSLAYPMLSLNGCALIARRQDPLCRRLRGTPGCGRSTSKAPGVLAKPRAMPRTAAR